MKVEELTQYGKTLSSLPKDALKKQESIVLREIRNRFGLIGILPFFIRLFLGQRLHFPKSDLLSSQFH
jgi:hypothetical protein